MKNIQLSLLASLLVSSGAMASYTFENAAGDSLTIDGRFEGRYQDKGGDHQGEWNSGSSRFGIKGVKQLDHGWQGFGHSEWGYNSNSKGGDIYSRLLYTGLEHDTYGKIAVGANQWSTFYDVAWFTDMGRTFGTRASGVYNLSDWGMASGTGRAEDSVTYRNRLNDKLKYGFTYQTTRTGVKLANGKEATFKHGLGASVLYQLMDNLTVGMAYHQNEITDIDAGTNLSGDTTARIALLGLNYTLDGFFLGLTYSQGQDWEVTDRAEFYDSRGAELYTHYHFDNGLRLTFNANHLTDTDGRANGYKRTTYVPGVEYHFDQNKLLVWSEYQIDKGNDYRAGNGQLKNGGNQFATGVRYYF